jgi:Cu+-exporting ATPase
MGLATPVALMAGVNAAARRGIMVRDAVALETCGKVDVVMFDKTGTLTQGRPTVAHREVFQRGTPGGGTAEDWAASLAAPSSHPIARAVAGISNARFPMEDWQEVPGMGLRARAVGREWRLGSATWLEQEGIKLDAGAPREAARRIEGEGATPVWLAIDGEVVALLGLRDALRPDTRRVVAMLRARGLRVGMVSGDREDVAHAVAREVGIDPGEVRAGVRPEGKAACIEALRREGAVVAFVGDGNNDGPALAAADLGIAVLRATDVAREAAGIVLLGDRLDGVAVAMDMAEATLRTIRQNLFWAFFYNAAAVPMAAIGLAGPAVCAAAMGLSDLVVVGNALRLARRANRTG